jgi:hypothetical protein
MIREAVGWKSHAILLTPPWAALFAPPGVIRSAYEPIALAVQHLEPEAVKGEALPRLRGAHPSRGAPYFAAHRGRRPSPLSEPRELM